MNLSYIIKVAVHQLWRTVRHPSRSKLLLDPNARRLLWLQFAGVRDDFKAVDDQGRLRRREYDSYAAYIEHQKSKLEILKRGEGYGYDGTDLQKYDAEFRSHLRDRLRHLDFVRPGASVLCLAARLGTEVKAFIDCGCFAVGVDLNAGHNNPYVLYGDFHHLVFADASIDVVYTNSIDHAYSLELLCAEIVRVLKPRGYLVAEIQLGERESGRSNAGRWESLVWDSAAAVIAGLSTCALQVVSTSQFAEPWPGVALVAQKRGP